MLSLKKRGHTFPCFSRVLFSRVVDESILPLSSLSAALCIQRTKLS